MIFPIIPKNHNKNTINKVSIPNQTYKINNYNNVFKIPNFKFNTPVIILTIHEQFLSCHEYNNLVYFTQYENITDTKKWIIERDVFEKNVFYIKSAFTRYNETQYLGCPNENNQVYLYTAQNEYTKWSIIPINNNLFQINYIGNKFDKKKIEIVVSRFNENIEWAIPYNDIVTIYNKGSDIDLDFTTIYSLENVGREGHTYLYHIIQNYDQLSEQILFLQGNPKDDTIRNELDDRWIENKWGDSPSTAYNIEDYLFKKMFWVSNLRPSFLYCEDDFDKVMYTNIESDLTMKQYFEKYIQCDNLSSIPTPFYWFQKGQFICKREHILSNDISFYHRLIESINYTNNPIEGHYLERFWYYILHMNLNEYRDPSKNIFSIWTKGDIVKNPDVLSCFFSMAEYNPEKNIYIMSNIIDPILFIKYQNIHIVKYSIEILLADTPAFNGYFDIKTQISNSKYWYSHETDLIRFIMLYKYGGIYLDSDIVVLRNIDYEHIKNTVSLEADNDDSITGSAFLCFEKKHPILKEILANFWTSWDTHNWACVGPSLVNQFRSRIHLLPVFYFYPISFEDICYYSVNECFLSELEKNRIDQIQHSYGIHLWNSRLKKHLFELNYKSLIIDTNSFIYKLIQKNISTFKIEKKRDVILNSVFKLVRHSKIDTQYALFNTKLKKFVHYCFHLKKLSYVDSNELSSFILYEQNHIIFISLNAHDTNHTIDINNIPLIF